ncbi:Auxin-induced protein 15A [Apostasia shenzhenica]|uniref:Auxin-induced protein 15A n=1 Tax=Apostasia shenzhenica TaxID=1088818 RepID=A0A2H9ZW37_9ASPA|nr:Auxin-induced protein 15A [Apostasia shenzhenica]
MLRLTKLTRRALGLAGLKAESHGRRLLRRRALGYEKLASSFFSPEAAPPAGHLPVYVGEERRRFVIPTRFLSHPLFSMLLEKARQEYGFQQRSGLAFPCSVSVFVEVVWAVERFHGSFDLEKLAGKLF